MIYEFTHATDAKRRIWVAWSPTGSGRVAKVELPKFDGVIERAERTPLKADEIAALDKAFPRGPKPRGLPML